MKTGDKWVVFHWNHPKYVDNQLEELAERMQVSKSDMLRRLVEQEYGVPTQKIAKEEHAEYTT